MNKTRSLNLKGLMKNYHLKLGLLLLGIALLLAFASINRQEETYRGDTMVLEGRDVENHTLGLQRLESKREAVESEITLNYTNDGPESKDDVNVTFSDYEFERNRTINIDKNNTKTIELKDDSYWIKSNFNATEGDVKYNQRLVYTTNPYGLLAIPAFVLTIVGMVLTYKGKYDVKAEMELEEKSKKQKDTTEDEGEEGRDFMGIDWGKE